MGPGAAATPLLVRRLREHRKPSASCATTRAGPRKQTPDREAPPQSAREIGRTLGVARSTIQDNLRRAHAIGIAWPVPAELTDDMIEQRLWSHEWGDLRSLVGGSPAISNKRSRISEGVGATSFGAAKMARPRGPPTAE
jgi:hypothetical protein